jgi:hypothetical protein
MATDSYINRLPNEILSQIFTLVYEDGLKHTLQGKEDGSWISSILVLRAVSRRFRCLVSELTIWRQDKFDITALFQPPQTHISHYARVVRSLLQDERLVAAMSLKQRWEFTQSPEVFFTMFMEIPQMRHNTRKLSFIYYTGLNFAFSQLSEFTRLTCLNISIDWEVSIAERAVDLGLISDSCPFLEELRLHGLTEFCGDINQLSRLRELSILYVGEDGEGLGVFNSQLVPLDSYKTLSSFALDTVSSEMIDIDPRLFEPFVNLTKFRVTRYLTSHFCKILTHGKFVLTILSIDIDLWVDKLSILSILGMLRASGLQQLRHLDIGIRSEPEHVHGEPKPIRLRPQTIEQGLDHHDQIINAITTLSKLEMLQLTAGLRLSSCHKFARLTALKYLNYTIFRPYIDGNQRSDIGSLILGEIVSMSREARVQEVQKRFQIVFERFPRKPEVVIREPEEFSRFEGILLQ